MSAPPPGRGPRPGSNSPRPRSGLSFPASGAHSRSRAVPRQPSANQERTKTPPGRVRPRVLFGGVVLVALALVVVRQVHPGTASSTPPAPHRVAPVHFSVGLVSCTFTDPSRETRDYRTGALVPGRVLTTEIRYPTISPAPGLAETPGANPALRHGPFPLVIFAHGYDLTPGTYKNLLDVWVKAGFVVAAPLFPDTNAQTVDALGKIYSPEADDANQPGDVAFLVNTVLADASVKAPGCGIVHRLVKPGGAAITGQSDGAVSVAALAYAAAYQVPGVPIKAVISLSGEKYPAPSGSPTPYASVNGGPPLLVTQSSTDTCSPPQNSVALYG
ncbi:MAG TPA: hypothetical protein VG368_00910, partial [Acidimicrobiales bacterium]|nr:hypothetical protein [Acidimicrobiales bacterium]